MLVRLNATCICEKLKSCWNWDKKCVFR